jgi:hypothetical protein
MIAFVHIPKTAGTRLDKIITHQYLREEIYIHFDTHLKELRADIPESNWHTTPELNF